MLYIELQPAECWLTLSSIDMPKLRIARNMWVNSTAELHCNSLIAQLKDVDFKDGHLECHSNANINNEGKNAEDSDSNTFENDSFLTSVGKLATQIILEVRRLVF
jgi:hypothetical protein